MTISDLAVNAGGRVALTQSLAAEVIAIDRGLDFDELVGRLRRDVMPRREDFLLTHVDPATTLAMTWLIQEPGADPDQGPSKDPLLRSRLEFVQLGYVIGRVALRTEGSKLLFSGLTANTLARVRSRADAVQLRTDHSRAFDIIEQIVAASAVPPIDELIGRAPGLGGLLSGIAEGADGIADSEALYLVFAGLLVCMAERHFTR